MVVNLDGIPKFQFLCLETDWKSIESFWRPIEKFNFWKSIMNLQFYLKIKKTIWRQNDHSWKTAIKADLRDESERKRCEFCFLPDFLVLSRLIQPFWKNWNHFFCATVCSVLMWDLTSQTRIEPESQWWKHQIITTRPQGNSPKAFFWFY